MTGFFHDRGGRFESPDEVLRYVGEQSVDMSFDDNDWAWHDAFPFLMQSMTGLHSLQTSVVFVIARETEVATGDDCCDRDDQHLPLNTSETGAVI